MERLTHAGAVVVRDADGTPEYLLVSASGAPNELVLPKGHIQAGEGSEATALRELREEAGIKGKVIAPLGTLKFTFAGEDVRAGYYLIEYGGAVAAKEARRLVWCDYYEALQRISHDNARHLLEAAHVEWRRLRDGGQAP